MNFVYWLALFSTAVFANLLGLNISNIQLCCYHLHRHPTLNDTYDGTFGGNVQL